MNESVLIIDDDRKLNNLLLDYLAQFAFRVSAVTSPREGLRQIKQNEPDAVILDIMLPEMDGFETCKEIRKISSVPILMLTARGDVTDRILGLEIGADDYLPKPFEPRELVARIKSILRRGSAATKKPIKTFGPLIINSDTYSAALNGEKLDLTTAEFEILNFLSDNPSKVMDRDKILEGIRGIEWNTFNRSVDVLISRLRAKLGDDPKYPRFLRTIRGAGYMFYGDEDT